MSKCVCERMTECECVCACVCVYVCVCVSVTSSPPPQHARIVKAQLARRRSFMEKFVLKYEIFVFNFVAISFKVGT